MTTRSRKNPISWEFFSWHTTPFIIYSTHPKTSSYHLTVQEVFSGCSMYRPALCPQGDLLSCTADDKVPENDSKLGGDFFDHAFMEQGEGENRKILTLRGFSL